MTSESTPESGVTQYVYDTDPGTIGASRSTVVGSNWHPPYNGDLVKKYDANGNTTCKTYDAHHRQLSASYGGPNTTTNHYFVYDSATVNGQSMTNAKTRAAEAYTATCQTCTKATDEGFSYSARGELTDIYEKTPNSGIYYHLAKTHWENGIIKTISGLPRDPTITYGPDREGRWKTVSASSGQNPVTQTQYNVAGQVTSMTLGSGDSDGYQYDPNTLRMTQYSFKSGLRLPRWTGAKCRSARTHAAVSSPEYRLRRRRFQHPGLHVRIRQP